MKTKKPVVIVEAIATPTEKGKVGFNYPTSVLENTTLAGKELVIKPVEELAYKYDGTKFQEICYQHELTKEEYEKVRELVFLNSGYITPMLLRGHLTRGYGRCALVCEDLIASQQAAEPEKGRNLYWLDRSKRSGFM